MAECGAVGRGHGVLGRDIQVPHFVCILDRKIFFFSRFSMHEAVKSGLKYKNTFYK